MLKASDNEKGEAERTVAGTDLEVKMSRTKAEHQGWEGGR
jgi:hypothetical protein